MGEVIVFPIRNTRRGSATYERDSGDFYQMMLIRRYRTRDEAHAYLTSRGFLFLPSGWKNGRWIATVEPMADDFAVAIGLPLHAA